jgi:tetratricopeptide (TPR) repeat protein
MRYLLCAWLVLLAAPLLGLADEPTLKEARKRWLRGNYEEARSIYEEVVKDAKQKIPATIGLSKALQSKGEYDKALEVIDAALKDEAADADLLARRAELLYLRGRWEDADKAIAEALKASKEHFLARWIQAQIQWDRGELKEADTGFRWFVRTYSQRSENDKDIKDPDELLLVGLAGSENARWHSLADQFTFILNEVYADALKADKDFWLSEYNSGLLLLEKYNRGEAVDAFNKALTINPNAAEALVGKGAAALQQLEIKEAEDFAEQALKINPNLTEALQLRADVYLTSGEIAASLRELEQARKINPRDEATLGRIAACFHLLHKKADFDALVKEVTERNPKPGVFYFQLGERLDERRHFDVAEQFYKKSSELRPMLPWPRNSLGLLYMRMGREKEARTVLNEAWKADPFNVRVSNTRKVLKHLDDYETIKTDHFEIRFDAKRDKDLANYMAEYLEGIYADLSEKFQYKPKGPILVEVFNSHEMFSGRVIALPDLHTIGACTGRMFAMVSPHGKGIRKPFNWGRVLRHELVHIFNLEQTDMQVTHWFTEGVAVINEGYPRPQIWNQLLLERVPSGELMNLDNIDLGFIRPRSPMDWNMAYCQSQLYIEYLKSKYGPKSVGELLNAYRDGLDTDGALQKVCKVDKATFEKGYREYLDEVAKSLRGKPAEKVLGYKELKEASEKSPDDLDLAARLAEQTMKRDKVEARKLADAVLAKKNNHPLASFVKAKLLLQGGDQDDAQALLEAAVDKASPEPKVLLELGKIYYEAGELAKAEEMFELGRKVEPYDSQWLQELAKVHAQNGDKQKQIAVLKELVPTDADDLEHRKRLAKMLLDAGQFAEAEHYAREALEIDIRDADVHETLYQALAGQKKEAEADRLKKMLEK